MRGTDTTTDPKAIRFADIIEPMLRIGIGPHVTVTAVLPYDDEGCIEIDPPAREGVELTRLNETFEMAERCMADYV